MVVPENPRLIRGEGVVELSIMNAHLNPISNLRISLSAPGEFDLEKTEVAAGTLPAGGVAKLLIPYSLDDDAAAGEKEWSVKVSYDLQAERLRGWRR